MSQVFDVKADKEDMKKFGYLYFVGTGLITAYELAKEECKRVNSAFVPSDFSVRTYACENFLYTSPSTGASGIVGRATFAFECGPVGVETRCTTAQVRGADGTNEKRWNCTGIR